MRTVCTKLTNDDFKKLSSICSEKKISVSEQSRRLIFSNFEGDDLPKSEPDSKAKSPDFSNAISLSRNLIKFKEYELAKLNQFTKKLSDDKTKMSAHQDNMKKISEINQDLNALRIIEKQLESF